MPSFILKDAKTVWVGEKPWSSPDGKVTIWSVKLEVDGSREIYSTMSHKIATEGFIGDLELYTNDKGKEYVRQAPKEDQANGQSTGWAKDGDAITAAMAVKLAYQQFCSVEGMLPKNDENWRFIEYNAEMIYKIIGRVKGTPAVIDSTPTTADEPLPDYQGD